MNEKYDENSNLIYCEYHNCVKHYYKYDENNNRIHFKNNYGLEYWYKYGKNNNRIKISEQEYKKIEFRAKEKEYLSRTKCSRFELMEI